MNANVDLFADVVAALFADLYMSFPVPIDIEIDVLGDRALDDVEPVGGTCSWRPRSIGSPMPGLSPSMLDSWALASSSASH